MSIQFLSDRYTIRDLLPQDAKMVCEVLKANTIFYKYHPPMVTVESILEDMEALPPNKGYEDNIISVFSARVLWLRLWT